jgi:hypothetical protein
LNIKQLLFGYIDPIKDLLNDKFEITQWMILYQS